MVRIRQKLDSNNKIYVPKILRDAGFDDEIDIAPNTRAFVAFPSRVPLEQVVASLHIIAQDLKQSLKVEQAEKEKPVK